MSSLLTLRQISLVGVLGKQPVVRLQSSGKKWSSWEGGATVNHSMNLDVNLVWPSKLHWNLPKLSWLQETIDWVFHVFQVNSWVFLDPLPQDLRIGIDCGTRCDVWWRNHVIVETRYCLIKTYTDQARRCSEDQTIFFQEHTSHINKMRHRVVVNVSLIDKHLGDTEGKIAWLICLNMASSR